MYLFIFSSKYLISPTFRLLSLCAWLLTELDVSPLLLLDCSLFHSLVQLVRVLCCGVMICGRREKSAKSESLDYYRSVFVNTIGGLLYSGDTNIWNKPLLITLL